MMQSMVPWKPKVTRRPHPPGATGTRASLDEVAKRIREGFDHPKVRAWAGIRLREAGNPKGPIARAAALLEAQRKQNIYLPDPEGVEYMPAAHVTLGDGVNEPEMVGEDCDGLTIGLLAACEASGIRTAVVGAAYDEERNISHVLGMVNDGKGNWYYVDPSSDYPFGEAMKATYEDVIDTRTGKHICVADACSVPLQGTKSPDVGPGRFVGVDGLPGMLGSLGDEMGQPATKADNEALRTLSARLGASWNTLVAVYTDMRDVAQILEMPPPGDPANKVWTPETEQNVRNAEAMVGILRMALEQAADGARKVFYYENGSGPMEGVVDLGIERLPGDPYYVALDQDMRPRIFLSSDNTPVNVSGQVGFPLVLGGVIVICSAINTYLVKTVVENLSKQAEIAAKEFKNKREFELLKGGTVTPEWVIKRDEAEVKIKDIEAKLNPPTDLGKTAKDTAEAASSLVTTLVGGAAVLAVGYVAFQAYQKAQRK
jgi:transglutaminase-like putative cysteine protease